MFNAESPYQMVKSKVRKRKVNNCHILDLVQTFSYIEPCFITMI